MRNSKEFPGVEWYENTEEFIKINNRNCNGCANCVKICLASCFEIKNQKARVKNLQYCMECAACWYVCEKDAIEFDWPKSGRGYRSEWG